MSNLYWYTSSYTPHVPFSRIVISPKDFFLIEEKVSLPNFKQLLFKKDTQSIQVILYESELHQETYLFVQECDLKEGFINKLQSKAFSSFHQDMFIMDDEPHKMIKQIEESIKYYEIK